MRFAYMAAMTEEERQRLRDDVVQLAGTDPAMHADEIARLLTIGPAWHRNPEPWHGTTSGYGNHGCRCTDCKAAHAASVKAARDRRAAHAIPSRVHGTVNGYGNYRCRCDRCKRAWAADERRRHAATMMRPGSESCTDRANLDPPRWPMP